ncbi:MAG: UpxY family transcription antiterminator [Chitinophagaceae bacterium]|nr:UpxY family transcription antiterminator [Chitinophagaceae bacterium]
MSSEKKWYAVYTKPRWEKKVADLLHKRRVDSFCPLNKVLRQWADRKKIVEEPLFTSYVFVCASEAEKLTVRQTDGVLNFVYWLGQPAVIKDEEIEAIRIFLGQHEQVKLEKVAVNVTDKVKIVHGPFAQIEGNVVEVRKNSVRILLPSLGYAMVAEIAKTKIEVINIAPAAAYSSGSIYSEKMRKSS